MLVKAGVEQARAVIACTSTDLVNLEVALDARELCADIRVVLRLFDQRLAEKIARGFDIQVAFSASGLAAPAFASAAVDKTVRGTFYVSGRLLVSCHIKLPVSHALSDWTVEKYRDEYEVRILMQRTPKGELCWNPGMGDRLGAKNDVAIMGPFEQVQRLKGDWGL